MSIVLRHTVEYHILQLAFNGLSFGIFDEAKRKLVGIIINSIPEEYKQFDGFDEIGKQLSSRSAALLRVSGL